MTTAEPSLPSAERPERPDRSAFWSKALRGWDIAFYLMMLIGLAAMSLGSPDRPALLTVLALVATLVLAYTVIGRRAARSGDWRLALVYLALLITLTVAIVWVNPSGSILLFVAYSQIWFFAATRREGVLLCVVLTVGVFGAIAAYNGFDPDRLPQALTQGSLALAFAVLLGLWVTRVAEQSEERAELVDQLKAAQAEVGRSHHAAGVAAERERMAREIHDTLAQGFTSIVMLAQTATADLRRGDVGQAAARVDLVERTARDNLAEARALVAAFAPVGLDGSTLGEALARLAHRFEQETGVRVEVVLPAVGSDPGLDREREVILLRAAQEALANVRRHAQAHHVQLVLSRTGTGTVHLEVVDDGRGIDPSVAEGFGLRGMRERVTSGGGRVAVTSGERGGTRVRVTLPDTHEVVPRSADDRVAEELP